MQRGERIIDGVNKILTKDMHNLSTEKLALMYISMQEKNKILQICKVKYMRVKKKN